MWREKCVDVDGQSGACKIQAAHIISNLFITSENNAATQVFHLLFIFPMNYEHPPPHTHTLYTLL